MSIADGKKVWLVAATGVLMALKADNSNPIVNPSTTLWLTKSETRQYRPIHVAPPLPSTYDVLYPFGIAFQKWGLEWSRKRSGIRCIGDRGVPN